MTDVGVPFLTLERLSRRFGNGAGVEAVSLSLGKGEILALLGPSGSGKTTTLRLLAGFEVPDSGRILVEGDDVTKVPAAQRRFGMVFQHYALFPHLTVGENVGFGLESGPIDRAERARRVAAALEAVDLAGFENRAVASLSGGQQQRVAVARAIAPEPRVLLLDEPLSNLDPALRERTRRELRQLIQRIGITTVLVTHEQEEAFDLADRVAVLEAGHLDQVGTPIELYRRPATAFVASFIGRAALVSVTADSNGVRLAPTLPPITLEGVPRGAAGTLAIRPEAFVLRAKPDGSLGGRVLARRFLGASTLYRVGLEAGGVELESVGPPDAFAVGDAVGLVPTGAGLAFFPGQPQ